MGFLALRKAAKAELELAEGWNGEFTIEFMKREGIFLKEHPRMKNKHQHAALGHYADVRKLKHAVDAVVRTSELLISRESDAKNGRLVVDVSTRMAFSASCKSKNEPDVHKATESILTQIRGIAANMRILTRDPMYCSVHLFSGDDDRRLMEDTQSIPPHTRITWRTRKQCQTVSTRQTEEPFAESGGVPRSKFHIPLTIPDDGMLPPLGANFQNILPKTDSYKEVYTPYNRLTGGTAPGNVFYPFGVIGYYIDRKEPKTSPVRRRPCIYLSTLLEPPRPGNGKPHYQFLVLDWLHAQNNQPQHWKQRTIYASFIRHDTAPVDIRSAFKIRG
ncbi:unnamed protein product [Bathycoccus prasinos]